MQKIIKNTKKIKVYWFNFHTVPVALFGISFLAYGLYLAWMGFYFDDLPWIWFSHASGPEALRRLEFHRPLSSWLFSFGTQLLGQKPLNWQLFTFFLRTLSGITAWWTVRMIWPKRELQATAVGMLFLIYPGFGQQFVSVNNSRHILGLVLYLFSLGVMARVARNQKRAWIWVPLAVLLSLLGMLTTEYYYGLELLRPFVLWIILDRKGNRIQNTILHWLPYLAALVGIFIWRISVSRFGNYDLNLLDSLSAAPFSTIQKTAQIILEDIFLVTFGAWMQTIKLLNPFIYGWRTVFFSLGRMIIIGIGIFFYLTKIKVPSQDGRWGNQAVSLGMLALIFGGLSFWITNLNIGLGFSSDRFNLSFMFGCSLLIAGVLEWLFHSRTAKLLLLSLIISLSINYHYQNALTYREDWNNVNYFFNQLVWRIPGLQPGTAFISDDLTFQYSWDNSLTAPLNWIYFPEFKPAVDLDYWYPDKISSIGSSYYPPGFSFTEMPLSFYFLDLRLGSKIPALEQGLLISGRYRYYQFEGSTDQMILIHNQPPYCLRVLDSNSQTHFLGLSKEAKEALPFSNLDQIEVGSDPPATLPDFFGPELPPDWCYYFQKAELARQQQDWAKVAALGDEAMALFASPNHPSELEPFIEGYAYTGRWEDAIALSMQVFEKEQKMVGMLCTTWQRIEDSTLTDISSTKAVFSMKEILACP